MEIKQAYSFSNEHFIFRFTENEAEILSKIKAQIVNGDFPSFEQEFRESEDSEFGLRVRVDDSSAVNPGTMVCKVVRYVERVIAFRNEYDPTTNHDRVVIDTVALASWWGHPTWGHSATGETPAIVVKWLNKVLQEPSALAWSHYC